MLDKPVLSAVSLFSGCGGFDYGAKQAGINIVWANDKYEQAAKIYRQVLPDVDFIQKDVREIKVFPKADILMGCYPCTGFSLGSRRKWKDSEMRDLKSNDDNFLFLEFIRVLKQIKPKYLVVENVSGMMSAGDGWFLSQQITAFNNLGYKIIDPFFLNAIDFGIAQTRKRMFIVGIREDVNSSKFVLPKPTHGEGLLKQLSLKDAIGDPTSWLAWPKGDFFDFAFHGHYLTRNRKRLWTQPSYTIVADAHHIPLHPIGEPMVYVEKDKWSLQGNENRRLSWKECAEIQGLPKSIKFVGSLSGMYRVIGNAVPPVFGRTILDSILISETGN